MALAVTDGQRHRHAGQQLKKAVPLTVYWNKSMYFNGTFAEFHGSIQAEQENARLACQALEVFFDKPISLKERESSGKKKEGEAASEKAQAFTIWSRTSRPARRTSPTRTASR